MHLKGVCWEEDWLIPSPLKDSDDGVGVGDESKRDKKINRLPSISMGGLP